MKAENPKTLENFLEDLLRKIVREEVQAAINQLNGKLGGVGNMMNADEAATFLGYSRDWVYRNWQKMGGRKIGKRGIRFSRRDLEAWTSSRRG